MKLEWIEFGDLVVLPLGGVLNRGLPFAVDKLRRRQSGSDLGRLVLDTQCDRGA